ncbi:MAG: indolepyruvate oxidoreductase subunit beta [Oscillospiraceae bacterium]|nr:indolepyruvate oxidoreductase subunit beta [Oscillospiraceae bacterium]
MSDNKNILIAGVGGQGTLLTSRILGNVLTTAGFDVKISEVHGMAQRGGAVITFVKYGKKVYSPVIDFGEADFILCFERLEAARRLPYLKDTGIMIISDQRISPMPVITGNAEYPERIIERIKETGANVRSADALSLALEAGSPKSVNIVLLGLFSTILEFSAETWDRALEAEIKPVFLDLNKKAFALGRAAGR